MEAASYALSTVMRNGPNSGFLRSDAYLLVIFVSDEDDCSDEQALAGQPVGACYEQREALVPVMDYVQEFQALKADPDLVRVGAIVGPHASEGCGTVPGKRYWQLTQYVGGLLGNICDQDWTDILYRLGLDASGVHSSFTLSDAAKPETLEVYVDEEPSPQDETSGWTYDAESWTISFFGDAIPPRGSVISVTYTIQSGG